MKKLSKKTTLALVVPWLLAGAYLFGVAEDRYEARTQVLMRSVGDASPAPLAAALMGSPVRDESQRLALYLNSPTVALEVDRKLKLREHFSLSGHIDVLQRLWPGARQEDWLDYFSRRVRVRVDDTTNTLNVSADAFDSKVALAIVQEMLSQANTYANAESQKAASTYLADMTKAVEAAREELTSSRAALEQFQSSNGLFDAEVAAKARGELVGSLEGELAKAEIELAKSAPYLSADAPELQVLKTRVSALRSQLDREHARNGAQKGLSKQANDFARLKTNLEIAQEKYRKLVALQEEARVDASRTQKRLMVLSEPVAAERPEYPARWMNWGLTALALVSGLLSLRLGRALLKDFR